MIDLSLFYPPRVEPKNTRLVNFDKPIQQQQLVGARFDAEYSEMRKLWLLDWLKKNPDSDCKKIRASTGMRRGTIYDYLTELVAERKVISTAWTTRKPATWRAI